MSSAKLITEISQPIAKGDTAKWSYISLIYTLFYLFPLVMNLDEYKQTDLALAAVIYVLFILLFFQVVRNIGRKAALPTAGIVLLSAIGAGVYPGTNILFGYAGFFSGYYFNAKQSVLFLMANIAAQLTTAVSFNLVTPYFLGPSLAVTISLYIYGAFSRKEVIHQHNKEQQSEQIEQLAAIAERERIARDMHDLLGHSLSSLALKSELAQKLMSKGQMEKASQEIGEVADLSRKTLAEVREAVTGLKKRSLQAGLSDLIEELRNLGFSTQFSQSLPRVNAKVESALLMLCKEWVTNILRHSNGDTVNIALSHTNKAITLLIKDNGQTKNIVAGNGIIGMRSRVDELDGSLSINQTGGVELHISLPYKEHEE